MTELLLLALGASLVNQFAATTLPGLRSTAGAKDRFHAAAAMAVAVLCVLPLACGIADVIARVALAQLAPGNLHTLALLLVVATAAPVVERSLRPLNPRWNVRPQGFLPLLAMNCSVLGVGFVHIAQRPSPVASLGHALVAAAVFALVLVMFTLLDERVDSGNVPRAFRGAPIALVTAGLFALAVAGLGTR